MTKHRNASDEPGELPPLPERLPASVEQRIGEVEFRGGLPTRIGIEKIYDVQDFQRACQIYQWAIPAVGVMGLHKANLANGATGQTDWVVYDDFAPRSGILTPEAQGAYVLAFPDLEATGPLVLEYSAGKIAGYVMDCWQRPLIEFGQPGPEKGARGGKLLLVGPGHATPEDGKAFRTVNSPTRVVAVIYRIMSQLEIDRYTPHNRLYPLGLQSHPPDPKVIIARRNYMQSHPRGLAYWEWVHQLIQREPVHERDRWLMAMLRSLGIQKGRPFEPDERTREILEDATALGEQMARAIVHHKRASSHYYREGIWWQHANLLDPFQRRDEYDELDERTRFFYEAFGSPHVARSTAPGMGTACLSSYRDSHGDWLDGSQSYRLRISASPPVRQFWALTAYDLDSRTLLPQGSAHAEIHSGSTGLRLNSDGSLDVYFGPNPPDGREQGWIQTVPGRFWYAYLRLVGPTEAYFDRAWPLTDIENVTSPLVGWWATLKKPMLSLRPPGREGGSRRR
jgi:hypothetical protein